MRSYYGAILTVLAISCASGTERSCTDGVIRRNPSSPGTLGSEPSALDEFPPSFGSYRVCPGEAVTISWELNPTASAFDCACFNGAPIDSGRLEPVACAFSGECGEGEQCIDGLCCNRACGSQCGFRGQMCPSPFEARLSATGRPDIPITSTSGSVVVRPESDTTFVLTGEEVDSSGRPTGRELPEQTIAIHVLDPGERDHYALGFAWECPRCSWSPSSLPHRDDELVQIVSVRNIGPYDPVEVGVERAESPPPSDAIGPVTVTRVPTGSVQRPLRRRVESRPRGRGARALPNRPRADGTALEMREHARGCGGLASTVFPQHPVPMPPGGPAMIRWTSCAIAIALVFGTACETTIPPLDTTPPVALAAFSGPGFAYICSTTYCRDTPILSGIYTTDALVIPWDALRDDPEISVSALAGDAGGVREVGLRLTFSGYTISELPEEVKVIEIDAAHTHLVLRGDPSDPRRGISSACNAPIVECRPG